MNLFVLQVVGDDGQCPAAFSQAARPAEVHTERPDGGSSDRAALRPQSVQVAAGLHHPLTTLSTEA